MRARETANEASLLLLRDCTRTATVFASKGQPTLLRSPGPFPDLVNNTTANTTATATREKYACLRATRLPDLVDEPQTYVRMGRLSSSTVERLLLALGTPSRDLLSETIRPCSMFRVNDCFQALDDRAATTVHLQRTDSRRAYGQPWFTLAPEE